MEGQIGFSRNYNRPKAGTGAADLKLKVAEYIATQYGYDRGTDVRSILNETKIGAQRKPTLQDMLNSVFTKS